MMKTTKKLLIAGFIACLGLIAPLYQPIPVGAAPVEVFENACEGSKSELCNDGDDLFGPNSTWTRIINTLIFIIGATAVLMIVIGGLRYVLSGGDAAGVNNAKNTIIYSVVGLVVALLANAIVNFVLFRI